jgi:hypothetical protein|tara:strand:- start:1957 stop:2232 length:276 start_codon:yes stop_codon:yes gene_type:complete
MNEIDMNYNSGKPISGLRSQIPKFVNFQNIFYFFCVLLLVIDFSFITHHETSFDSIPFFYAAFGFFGSVIFVILAVKIRKLLLRAEDYFDD